MREASRPRCSPAGPRPLSRARALSKSGISLISFPHSLTWRKPITLINTLPVVKNPFRLTAKLSSPSSRAKSASLTDNLYWHWSTNRAVRQGDWKLAWDKHARNWELYDLRADRTEARDLASEHPKLVASLINKWEAWAKMTDVKLKK